MIINGNVITMSTSEALTLIARLSSVVHEIDINKRTAGFIRADILVGSEMTATWIKVVSNPMNEEFPE